MHPAKSVIFFTVISGMGLSLMAILGIGAPELSDKSRLIAMIVAFACTVLGLISSSFHLGHPERAWRAFSQWRSSWLSREGVLAVVTVGLFALNAFIFLWKGNTLPYVGGLVSFLAIATIFATSMIYASIKAVPRWHSPATCWAYLWFGFASGALLFLCFLAYEGTGAVFAMITAGILATSWAVKYAAWWVGDNNPGPSSPESATGLGHLGEVRLLESPHSGENYLLNEMVFQIGRKHRTKLRWISFILAGLIPVIAVLLFSCGQGTTWVYVALVSHLIGLFAERWLFFAEADHVVRHFYGHR